MGMGVLVFNEFKERGRPWLWEPWHIFALVSFAGLGCAAVVLRLGRPTEKVRQALGDE